MTIRSLRTALGGASFLMPALAVYALFVLWPEVDIFWLGLQRWNGYGSQQFIGLGNLVSLSSDELFRISLVHSLIWLAGALTIAPALSLVLALAARRVARGAAVLSILVFPALLPATVTAALAILVFSPLSGLLNWSLRTAGLGKLAADWLGDPHLALGALFIIWLWSAAGIGTLLLYLALGAIGREYLELAAIEGAGSLWRLRRVLLPGIQRTLFVVAAIDLTLAAQTFDLVFVTTGGGPGFATMLLPIDMYGRAFGGQTGEGAAVASIQLLLVFAVLCALFPLWQRAPSLHTGDSELRQRGSASTARVILITACVATVLPLVWLPIMALQPGRLIALASPTIGIGSWTLGNIVNAWNAGMPSALVRSGALAASASVLTLGLTTPAAFALMRPFRWRPAVLAILLVGILQSTTVTIIPLFGLLKALGLLNTVWGILLPEVARAIPFAIMVIWAYLAGSFEDVLEAATVDGASPVQQLVSAVIPLARPALVAVAIWTFVSSWNEYLLPTIVSQDGSITTVPTVVAGFAGTLDTQFGMLAAGALLAMSPWLLIYLTLRRFAAAGLGDMVRRVR